MDGEVGGGGGMLIPLESLFGVIALGVEGEETVLPTRLTQITHTKTTSKAGKARLAKIPVENTEG